MSEYTDSENNLEHVNEAIAKSLVPADEQAQLPVPQKQDNSSAMITIIDRYLSEAGQLKLSKEEREVLEEEIKDDEIEIRPDGLLFPGWHFCADRLNKAFQGSWSLVPIPLGVNDPYATGQYDGKKNIYYRRFALFIRGKFVADAVGEQKYNAQNRMVSQGDAMEGAKSNALLRLCKPILPGMRKLWKQREIARWKREYAEAYRENGDLRWRLKGTESNGKDFREFMKEMKKERERVYETRYYAVLAMYNKKHANEVKDAKQRMEILSILRTSPDGNLNMFEGEENE